MWIIVNLNHSKATYSWGVHLVDILGGKDPRVFKMASVQHYPPKLREGGIPKKNTIAEAIPDTIHALDSLLIWAYPGFGQRFSQMVASQSMRIPKCLEVPPAIWVTTRGDHSIGSIPRARRCFNSSHLLFSSKIWLSSLKCVVLERGTEKQKGDWRRMVKQRLQGKNGELCHKNGIIDEYKKL